MPRRADWPARASPPWRRLVARGPRSRPRGSPHESSERGLRLRTRLAGDQGPTGARRRPGRRPGGPGDVRRPQQPEPLRDPVLAADRQAGGHAGPTAGGVRRHARPGRDCLPAEEAVVLGGVEFDRYSLGALTLTSHVMPNRSVHIPNVSPQAAFSRGISTFPPFDSLSK